MRRKSRLWDTGGRFFKAFEGRLMPGMPGLFIVRARAKLNLRLEIGPPAGNGLHEVRSVIADLRLADDIGFEPIHGAFAVRCEGVDVAERRNLAWRAAMALRPELRDWRVRVRKVVPIQAGLGGGSADAAAVLRGVARIMEADGVPIVDARLHMIAPLLGSDVSACLMPGLKIVEGTGERVTPFRAPAPGWGVLLLQPAARVTTADAYARFERGAKLAPAAGDLHALCAAFAAGDFERTCALLHNDFQAVVEAAFPQVAEARERLQAAGAAAAMLCGSGSCVAGLFESAAAAETGLAQLRVGAGEWAAVTGFADGADRAG